MNTTTVLFFIDEIGEKIVGKAITSLIRPIIIFDPNRPKAAKYFSKSRYESYPFPEKNKTREFKELIENNSATLGVIASFSCILRNPIIRSFPLGVVNLHFGKLPEYRGANTLQWTLINGDREATATLHYVDDGVDTGPIIGAVPVLIEYKDDAVSLQTKLINIGQNLLNNWLPKLLNGPVHANPQVEDNAKCWPRRKPEDGLIDWNKSDMEIRNLIRALVPPWPSAFYTNNYGQKILITRVLTLDEIAKLRHEVAR